MEIHGLRDTVGPVTSYNAVLGALYGVLAVGSTQLITNVLMSKFHDMYGVFSAIIFWFIVIILPIIVISILNTLLSNWTNRRRHIVSAIVVFYLIPLLLMAAFLISLNVESSGRTYSLGHISSLMLVNSIHLLIISVVLGGGVGYVSYLIKEKAVVE